MEFAMYQHLTWEKLEHPFQTLLDKILNLYINKIHTLMLQSKGAYCYTDV